MFLAICLCLCRLCPLDINLFNVSYSRDKYRNSYYLARLFVLYQLFLASVLLQMHVIYQTYFQASTSSKNRSARYTKSQTIDLSAAVVEGL